LVTELDRAKRRSADRVAVPRDPQVSADPGTGDAHAGIEKESDHPCFECVQCCTYVAIENYIAWYLYHRDVSVFVDWEGGWFLKFETRCDHLTSQGLCDSYSSRPVICKEFDWRECENRVESGSADKWLFENSDQFLRWFEERRPKTFRRFKKYMRKKHRSREEEELERVKITRLLPPPPGR
jgi:Fe-S-cluster containining protein